MAPPPKIQSYHCICTSLLLASTHKLSTLPTRQSPAKELILPLPSSLPDSTEDEKEDLPPEGYTILLGLDKANKVTIVRREDGFEKRMLYRCVRCRVVVGFEMLKDESAMEVDGKGKGKECVYDGKVIYLLPGGVMSTEVMMGGRKIGEEDVDVGRGVAVFE